MQSQSAAHIFGTNFCKIMCFWDATILKIEQILSRKVLGIVRRKEQATDD